MQLARLMMIAIAALALALPARAADLPPLTAEEAAAIAAGVDAAGTAGDPGFDALVAHVHSWGNLMRDWATGSNRPTDAVQVAWVDALVDDPKASDLGTDAVLLGKLIERAPARQRALVERWVIEPLDSVGQSSTAKRAVVLFVVRPASAMIEEPQPGWFVRAAGRYAGIAELPARDATAGAPPNRYATFVGATYEVSARGGRAPSGIFAWVGLVVAVLLGVFVTLVWTIQQSRSRGTSVLRNREGASDRESSS